jgi:Flp pilus assembly pilin Flp
MKQFLNRLRRDERGVHAVEFAMILPTFLLLIMGIFDIGFQIYAKSVLVGAIEEAARSSTLESNNASQSAVDQRVRDVVGEVASYATLSFTRTNFRNFSNVGQRETFNDTNGNGVRNAGECYEDRNGNNTWDAISSGASGQGGADDVVLFRATMSYDRIFPLWRFLGEPQNHSIVVSTVLRNQPFTTQNTAQVICA